MIPAVRSRPPRSKDVAPSAGAWTQDITRPHIDSVGCRAWHEAALSAGVPTVTYQFPIRISVRTTVGVG
jgi:hypothetical protein